MQTTRGEREIDRRLIRLADEERYEQEPPGNGMAVASVILGIIGAVIGFIPILGVPAIICGILAIVFGAKGWSKANRLPGHPDKALAIAGVILGVVAVALGIVGIVAVTSAVNELNRDLEQINPEG